MSTLTPPATTGDNTSVTIAVDESLVTLVLNGTNTHAITAHAQDINGNNQAGRTLYYVSRDPSIATVNSSGVITGVEPGDCVMEVSTQAFDNSIALFSRDGSPINKIYAEILVTVQEGVPIQPSFTLSASPSTITASAASGTASTSVTIEAVNGFSSTVDVYLAPNKNFGPALQGTVSSLYGAGTQPVGTFTLTLRWSSAVPGTYPFYITGFQTGRFYGRSYNWKPLHNGPSFALPIQLILS